MSTVNAADLNTDETAFSSEPSLIADSYLPYYEGWAGQKLKLKKGTYIASFEKVKEKENIENRSVNTAFDLIFSNGTSKRLKGLNGRFTIKSKRDGMSIRTNFKLHVDLNGDGEYTKDERLVKTTKEGFKIKDSITDYTSDNYRSAEKLSSLSESGYLSFEFANRWDAPPIRFDELSEGKIDSFFSVDFSWYSSENWFY